ncbi:MAG: ABC transporter ATP-binding protein [Pauljensenia sp.]
MSIEIENLHIRIAGHSVVEGVSLSLPDSGRLGLIGESGSGKTLTALAIVGLLPHGAEVSGSIRWNGRELVGLPDRELARIRGREIGVVFQEPSTALDPIRTVGAQIGDSLRIHYGLGRREVRERVLALAERVRLPDPEAITRLYPHELSGGQRQRVAIAQAVIARPSLIIADEPTTALDVTVQAGILDLFDDLLASGNTALIFISHDIALVSRMSDQVVVLSRGAVVETGSVDQILRAPAHPVTIDLVDAARATGWRTPAAAVA